MTDVSGSDFAFVCPGTCSAALVRPRVCGDERCNRKGEELKRVSVVYACPNQVSCRTEMSAAPGLCRDRACSHHKGYLEARAVVPVDLQLAISDPPEENRFYSSVWDNDEKGTGHGRSRLGSAQGWSALVNDDQQWMFMDAGAVRDSIAGLLITNRKDICHNQIVTRLAIDVAQINGALTNAQQQEEESTTFQDATWVAVDGGENGVFDTRLTTEDCDGFVPIRFSQPVRARYVRLRPLEWENHISLRCGLLLTGRAETEFRQTASIEYRPIADINQLPAKVVVTSIPGGLPPPASQPHHPPVMDIRQLPTGECEWAGRRMSWRVLEFNGTNISHYADDDPNSRAFAALPGQNCSITVSFRTSWNYNQGDYGPGCIVQLYYGMSSVFCTGVVKRGIHHEQGQNRTEFRAPTTPGLYYITQSISMMYNFVDNLAHHRNAPHNAIAVVRVLPAQFTSEVFPLLPRHMQNLVMCLLMMSRRRGDKSTIFSMVPLDAMHHIISYCKFNHRAQKPRRIEQTPSVHKRRRTKKDRQDMSGRLWSTEGKGTGQRGI